MFPRLNLSTAAFPVLLGYFLYAILPGTHRYQQPWSLVWLLLGAGWIVVATMGAV